MDGKGIQVVLQDAKLGYLREIEREREILLHFAILSPNSSFKSVSALLSPS